MSAEMIKAHGGGNVGRLITNTFVGVRSPIRSAGLESLVYKTTGVPRDSSVMEGVLHSTTRGSPVGSATQSGLMKSHEKHPTKVVVGQVPYNLAKNERKEKPAKAKKDKF